MHPLRNPYFSRSKDTLFSGLDTNKPFFTFLSTIHSQNSYLCFINSKEEATLYGMVTPMTQNYFGIYILTTPRNSSYHLSFYVITLPPLKNQLQERILIFKSFLQKSKNTLYATMNSILKIGHLTIQKYATLETYFMFPTYFCCRVNN
jgi:hypothetical protein